MYCDWGSVLGAEDRILFEKTDKMILFSLMTRWIWYSSHLKGVSDSFWVSWSFEIEPIWKVIILSYFQQVSIILWLLDHSSSDTNSVVHFAVVILKNLGNGDVICSPVGQQTPFISGLSNLIFGEKKSCFLFSYSYSLECEGSYGS